VLSWGKILKYDVAPGRMLDINCGKMGRGNIEKEGEK
jgi:hypothetical protein